LHLNVGDTERCAQAEDLIAVVCERLDQADATADDIVEAVEASLGSFLVEAEQAVAAAERVIKVTA
jgi:hypothetical protein